MDNKTEKVHTIPQIHPIIGYQTLGVHITANGNEETKVDILRKKIKNGWIISIIALSYYMKFIWPICYALNHKYDIQYHV